VLHAGSLVGARMSELRGEQLKGILCVNQQALTMCRFTSQFISSLV